MCSWQSLLFPSFSGSVEIRLTCSSRECRVCVLLIGSARPCTTVTTVTSAGAPGPARNSGLRGEDPGGSYGQCSGVRGIRSPSHSALRWGITWREAPWLLLALRPCSLWPCPRGPAALWPCSLWPCSLWLRVHTGCGGLGGNGPQAWATGCLTLRRCVPATPRRELQLVSCWRPFPARTDPTSPALLYLVTDITI